jgi:hypothetical protein
MFVPWLTGYRRDVYPQRRRRARYLTPEKKGFSEAERSEKVLILRLLIDIPAEPYITYLYSVSYKDRLDLPPTF